MIGSWKWWPRSLVLRHITSPDVVCWTFTADGAIVSDLVNLVSMDATRNYRAVAISQSLLGAPVEQSGTAESSKVPYHAR